jgi:hypothetical protein
MADLSFNEASSPVTLVGGDEQFAADVVDEGGQKRLATTSTNRAIGENG